MSLSLPQRMILSNIHDDITVSRNRYRRPSELILKDYFALVEIEFSTFLNLFGSLCPHESSFRCTEAVNFLSLRRIYRVDVVYSVLYVYVRDWYEWINRQIIACGLVECRKMK